MPLNIPILTLRLLDCPLQASSKKWLLNAAKDLLRPQEQMLKARGLDIDLFHNQEIRYSAIQLDNYQGTCEWTAVGMEAVALLEYWYELFKKEATVPLQNTVAIRETYVPGFLEDPKMYRIPALVISNNLAQDLSRLRFRQARIERMEKYLYGNIRTFLNHIGFEYDKGQYFLHVRIREMKCLARSFPVFHRQRKTACALTFTCNFRLPQTLRLGQSTALGHGKVLPVYRKTSHALFGQK